MKAAECAAIYRATPGIAFMGKYVIGAVLLPEGHKHLRCGTGLLSNIHAIGGLF